MSKCDYCQHVEMCGFRESLKERGCDFFDNGNKWIPVSKRLPNQDEYIKNNGLFNVSDGNRSYSEWFDIYDKQKFGEPTMAGFRVDYAVTAWMPLPESYKAERHTCGECQHWGTVNCSETYREPTKDDDVCESFKVESEDNKSEIL